MQDHIPVFYSAVGDLLVKLENEITNLGKISKIARLEHIILI